MAASSLGTDACQLSNWNVTNQEVGVARWLAVYVFRNVSDH